MKGGGSYRLITAVLQPFIGVDFRGPGRRMKGGGNDQALFFMVAAVVTSTILILILVSPVYSTYLHIHHQRVGWTAQEIARAQPRGYSHLVIILKETRKGTEIRQEWRWRDYSSPLFNPSIIPTSGLVTYP